MIQTLKGDYVVSQKLKEELSHIDKGSVLFYPLVNVEDGGLEWIISNYEDEKSGDWYSIIWNMSSLQLDQCIMKRYKVRGKKELGWGVTEEDMINSIESFFWNIEITLEDPELIEIILRWTEPILMKL